MKTMLRLLLLLVLLGTLFWCTPDDSPPPLVQTSLPTYQAGAPARTLAEFQSVLENMAQKLNIPGMSAGIVHGGRLVWQGGFGVGNRRTGQAVTVDTRFHLASLTKPFGAMVVLQLVNDGLLDLDDRVSTYGLQLENSPDVTIRHLLSHSSEGNPGTAFRYNGGRYALLEQIMEAATGQTFCSLLSQRILEPYGFYQTAPNPYFSPNCVLGDSQTRASFLGDMATGYDSYGQTEKSEPVYFSPAAGLVSSVRDLAKLCLLLDEHRLLPEALLSQMFSKTRFGSGPDLPYGLGWFIDEQGGLEIDWVYGYWDAHSGLIVRVPQRDLSFILLANSNMLSRAARNLGIDGDVTRSFAAEEFLNAFVWGEAKLP